MRSDVDDMEMATSETVFSQTKFKQMKCLDEVFVVDVSKRLFIFQLLSVDSVSFSSHACHFTPFIISESTVVISHRFLNAQISSHFECAFDRSR